MNLAHLLARSARVFPRRPAVALGERVLADYGALGQRCAALASSLRSTLRLAPGDRVGLVMTNSPEYVQLLWAAWWAGLAVVPVNAKLHPKEAEYILDHSGARVSFVTPDLAGTVSGVERVIVTGSEDYRRLYAVGDEPPIAAAAPDDLAWLFYTSGTTGRPKGVMITHRNLLAMTLCYFADVERSHAGDAFVLRRADVARLRTLRVPHVVAGARHVVPESAGSTRPSSSSWPRASGSRDFRGADDGQAARRPRRASGRAALDGLKTIVYGGGPMYVADIRRLSPRWGRASPRSTARANADDDHRDVAPHSIADARIRATTSAWHRSASRRAGIELRVADEDGSRCPRASPARSSSAATR